MALCNQSGWPCAIIVYSFIHLGALLSLPDLRGAGTGVSGVSLSSIDWHLQQVIICIFRLVFRYFLLTRIWSIPSQTMIVTTLTEGITLGISSYYRVICKRIFILGIWNSRNVSLINILVITVCLPWSRLLYRRWCIVPFGSNRWRCNTLHQPSPSSRLTENIDMSLFGWEIIRYGLSSHCYLVFPIICNYPNEYSVSNSQWCSSGS